jgi:quercetin dioxygenase-like cupin family protein
MTQTQRAPNPELLWFGNTLVSIAVPSQTGADRLCVVEHRAPHGDSPPLHVHRNEDEVFRVLAGRVRFKVGDEDRRLAAGDTLLAPKGVPHSYRVESAEGAHWLTITRGADFEGLLRAASRPAEASALPPEAAPSPEMVATLARLAAENGIDIVGPPLG